MTQTMNFGKQLQAAMSRYGQLCLGIDAHPQVLDFHQLPDTASGAEQLAEQVFQAAVGRVGVLKVQIALFERFGAAGYLALERFFTQARGEDILIIADAKRGEIGSSMAGYAAAWLADDSPLAADAMTLNPYLGVGALRQTLELAAASGRGAFLLAANSNPESTKLQLSGQPTVAAQVVTELANISQELQAEQTLSSFGVVIGATVAFSDYGITETSLGGLPILAPGFGHQGAKISELRSRFGALAPQVLVAQSRSLLMVPAAELADRLAEEQANIRQAVGILS